MRWSALLLLACTTFAFHIPTREEKVATWARLNTVSDFSDGVPPGFQLIFVNPIWRHGDRGPEEKFQGDLLDEDAWDFGGGGYGQLSPIGMRQHFELGQKLYKRYAEKGQFLSPRYRSKEIYARSTDRNRTLISAMSNFAGMYSTANAVGGTDYPDDLAGWPQTFVPIPIHTEYRYTDHVGDPDADCPRQDDLWDMAHQHPEYIAYDTKPRTQQTYEYLRGMTGGNSDNINFDNIYILRQGMLCERIHFPDNFTDWYPWYTDDVKQRTDEIDDQNIEFQNGIYGSGMLNGYDLTVELPKLRGGTLINDVVKNAVGVLDCYEGKPRCTDSDHFLKNLKYYVVSAHDTTIAAYLTVLEAKPLVLTNGGYPSYSAAVITEFFINTTSTGKERYFRVLFHDDENSDFRVITPLVSGCEIGSDFCKIEHLIDLAAKYAPTVNGVIDINGLCQQRVDGTAPITTPVAPPPPTSVPSTTTTKKPDDNAASSTVTVPTIPTTTSASFLVSSVSSAAVALIARLFI